MKDIGSKEELLKRFRDDPEVAAVLKKAPNALDAAKALKTVEYMLGTLYEAIVPAMAQMKQDPAAVTKISEALKSGEGIIKESDGSPINSGSKG